jgi:hypothetical protein
MTGPTPTQNQLVVSHVLVGLTGGFVIDDAISEFRPSPVTRLVAFVISSAGVAYLHHLADAPVADLFATLAA